MEFLHAHANRTLQSVQTVQYPTSIDNPSYFHDPYAKETGRDASGYLNAGLALVKEFPYGREKHPTAVWFTGQPRVVPLDSSNFKATRDRDTRLIFQDDGEVMNTASAAVIVAIDPKENEGRKEGWLFVTGFFGDGVVRTKIEL